MHLNRDYDHRRSLKRNLMKSFLTAGSVKTTKAKAKFVRGDAEKLVTFAKKGDLSARRILISKLNDKSLADKFISQVKGFKDRRGGYTKLSNLGRRLGDNAPLVKLEWVDSVQKSAKEKKV